MDNCEFLAEGAGFEPALPFGKHAFQACALSHSATPPIFFGHYRTRLMNAMLTISKYCNSSCLHCLQILSYFNQRRRPPKRETRYANYIKSSWTVFDLPSNWYRG